MAHRLGLAQARQAQSRFPVKPAKPLGKRRRFFKIHAAVFRPADFEDQPFITFKTVIAGESFDFGRRRSGRLH